ncbi:MAG: C4-dicarboxylate ABC transporter [Deltaproteobacteria bacterium RIFCSPLOWO2_02_FULL_50_16]|nr:MAG: C4-dicarboxylate ABC transporter [Deltaproteobacteria bacterium GWA2_50_8]OGQ56133.1 MAG: C4-dicarboxylate ABC transporter [Deltaproteobacteria bacterium RIFCSPLOWO2_02_FULL_50_16]
MILLIVLGILAAALLGAPLFTIFGVTAATCFHLVEIDTMAIIIEMLRLISAPALVAIPLFTFAGYMMAESNTPERLVNVSQALFGWMPGGLAIVCLLACAFFTAFTGASGVTIIALGGLLFPILHKRGYPENFSLGIVTTCGSLGLLFPPSLPLILYGVIANVDISQLFKAGVLPGILLIVLLGAYSIYIGVKGGTKRVPFKVKEVLKTTRKAAWEVPLPFIILIGIYGGIFTASEAAAICAFYVLIVEVFIYRDLHLTRDIPRIMKDSMVLVGGILIILAVALGFTSYLIDEQVPMRIFEFIKQYIHSQAMFLVCLNIFLLIVGCLMDIFSAIIVVVPIIIPIATAFGVNPVHLGIIFLTNLEIGYLTPPVGLNLFISSYRFKKSVMHIYRVTLPFLFILLLGLLIITYVPQLSLYLVEVLK